MNKTPINILALVSDAFGEFGGIAQYNRDLLSALSACNLVGDVIVLPRRTAIDPGQLPPRIRQLDPLKGRFSYGLAAVWNAHKYGPFQVVLCGHLYMAPLAAAIAWHLHASLWIQVHGLEAWDELSVFNRRAIERASLITSVSRYTRQRLLTWIDIDPVRIKVLANTVDPQFKPGPKPTYLKDRHGVAGKKILLTVSRLPKSDRYKGIDRVIRTLPRILVDHPDLIYIVAGDGDDRPWLQSLAIECGVAENVKFVGQVVASELPDYFRLADLFVMPSTGEGFGIVFLEAIGSGIDAIGGNKDGSVDPLCDGTLGQVVDPDDSEQLASAIGTALDSPIRDSSRVHRFSFNKFSQHLDALVGSPLLRPNERDVRC